MNKVIEYKGFFITIHDWYYQSEDEPKRIYSKYIAYISTDNFKYKLGYWRSEYDLKRVTLEEVIENCKSVIDNYLEHRSEYKITLTLKNETCNPELLMQCLHDTFKLSMDYYGGSLEKMEVFDGKDNLIYNDTLNNKETNYARK
jgi:hypothetical protein